jgi:hypothetical protein
MSERRYQESLIDRIENRYFPRVKLLTPNPNQERKTMSNPIPVAPMPTPGATGASTPQPGVLTMNFGGGPSFDAGGFESSLYAVVAKETTIVTGPDQFNPGKTRTQVRVDFEVEGHAQRGLLSVYMTPSMHEKSKTPGYLAALNAPVPTPEDPNWNYAAIVGLKAKAFVTVAPGKKDASRMYAKIEKLIKA